MRSTVGNGFQLKHGNTTDGIKPIYLFSDSLTDVWKTETTNNNNGNKIKQIQRGEKLTTRTMKESRIKEKTKIYRFQKEMES